MTAFDQVRAIGSNISRSVGRLGLFRGFFLYLYTVLVRKWPIGRGRQVVLRVPGTDVRVKARRGTHDAAAFRQIFLTGDYDFSLPGAPAIIVDAGAHVGYGATYFAIRYPEAKIFSIEPEASNIEVLKQNAAIHSNITVIESALWNSAGTVSISDQSDDVWSFRVKNTTPDAGEGATVPTITMPDLIRRLGQIDVLKVDIEGAEIELFSGNTDWLDSVGCIVIELHDEHRKGCSEAFYSGLSGRDYSEERLGENMLVRLAGTA